MRIEYAYFTSTKCSDYFKLIHAIIFYCEYSILNQDIHTVIILFQINTYSN